MSEQPELDQLDQRAALAAADLRGRAAARPAPAFDPARTPFADAPAARRGPGGSRRLLAVAAAVLLVAAVAGVLVSRSGHDDDDKAGVITTDPRPFVAGSLPKGFSMAGAGQVTADEGRGGSAVAGPVQLFGPADDDPQLGIAPMATWEPAIAEDGGGEPIEVGDRTLYPFDGNGIGKHAVIVVVDGQAALLVSNERDSTWLQDLATKVTVTAEGEVDLHEFELPDGWHHLGTVPDLLTLANPMYATNTDAIGKYVAYQRGTGEIVQASDSGEPVAATTTTAVPSGDDAAWLFVSSTPGDAAQLHAAALVADETSAVQVRGHDAALSSTSVSGIVDGANAVVSRSVVWIERSGELLSVSGSGLSERELLEVAEGVEPVDATTWKDLIERSQLGEFDPANASDTPVTTIADGRFDDGTRWVLGFRVDGSGEDVSASVDLKVATASSGDSSSSSTSGTGSGLGAEGDAIVSTTVEDDGHRSYGAALVNAAVDHVELRDDQGTVLATPEIHEGGGRRGIAVEVPDGAAVLVALDAQGNELGEIEFTRTPPGEGEEGSSGSSSGSGSSTATTMAGG